MDFGYWDDSRYVYYVELTELSPGGEYYFKCGDVNGALSEEKKFRTSPSTNNFTFVSGGDLGLTHAMSTLTKLGALHEPLFAFIGGDLAYGNAMRSCYVTYDDFLITLEKNLITPRGFTVPMVLAIGNHEAPLPTALLDIEEQATPDQIPFYLPYFAQVSSDF